MTPAEYGAALAAFLPPITEEQVEQFARLLATIKTEDAAA